MSHLRRALKILSVVGRHRLDEFVQGKKISSKFRLTLVFFKVFGQNKGSKGERLRLALEELGPIFIKFGQLLSTRPDMIPPDICRELNKLQDNVPPFSTETFKTLVEKALLGKIADMFADFDETPLASASIAQVHAATTLTGRDVVIKAVRPGIEKIILQDIRLMLLLANFIQKHSKDGERLHPVKVVSDYRNVILNELNLQSEGANASLLKHNFESSSILHVPEILWSLSNKDVLVMERIYATPITDIQTLTNKGINFKTLAERGIEIFFTQVFEHNFFHADMHPGNIFVDTTNPQSPTYLAIDCAIMGSLTPEDQFYMARNLLAIFKRDYRLVAELHIRSGWVRHDTSVTEFTNAIRSVCEPVFQRPLQEISMAYMMVQLFDTARRFNMEVQPGLVLLQKTLLNVEGLGRQLYPKLDLWTSAQPFLEKWLRQKYSPKGIFKQLKNHLPDWLEQLPKMPPLIYGASENGHHKNKLSLHESAISHRPTFRIWASRFGLIFIFISIVNAYPQWQHIVTNVPSSSVAMFALGTLLLALR